jgi:PhnB protein
MILAQLSVRRSREALAFYEAAFGATADHLVGDEDIVAQLSAYGGTFWIAEESPAHQNFSPETLGGGTVRLLLMVDDPDAAVERAVAAGATLVYAPEDAHGWRIGRIADPYGHHWEIATPLSPWPPPR